MDVGTVIAELMASPAWGVVATVVALALVEFATGILRAVAAGQFQFALVDTWVRKTAAGRVLPITALMLVGAAVPDTSILGIEADFFTATGTAAAAAFGISAAASIVANVRSQEDTPPIPE